MGRKIEGDVSLIFLPNLSPVLSNLTGLSIHNQLLHGRLRVDRRSPPVKSPISQPGGRDLDRINKIYRMGKGLWKSLSVWRLQRHIDILPILLILLILSNTPLPEGWVFHAAFDSTHSSLLPICLVVGFVSRSRSNCWPRAPGCSPGGNGGHLLAGRSSALLRSREKITVAGHEAPDRPGLGRRRGVSVWTIRTWTALPPREAGVWRAGRM